MPSIHDSPRAEVKDMGILSARKAVLFQVLSLIVLAIGVTIAYGKHKAPPPPPTTLPERINALAKLLPGVMLEDAGPTTEQIQKLVVDHMTEWIANRTPTDVEARRELENVFSLLHYPEVALPVAFAQPWSGETIIGAGYTFGWTDFDRQNTLAIFVNDGGKSHLATVTNFVPRVDMTFKLLPQIAWQDLRFLTYGTRPGKSQPRLSVVLYSFDGRNLKSLWENRDIYDGKIDIVNDKVTIRHLNEEEYVRDVEAKRKPSRYQATYQLTATGIQLIDDHGIPF